jgi:hypothetical protein
MREISKEAGRLITGFFDGNGKSVDWAVERTQEFVDELLDRQQVLDGVPVDKKVLDITTKPDTMV